MKVFTRLSVRQVDTGKTYWLGKQVEAIVEAGLRPMLCSLTRTAATELRGRVTAIPEEWIGTLHSHAYRAIGCPPMVDIAIFNVENPAFAINEDFSDDDYKGPYRAAGNGTALYQKYGMLRARCVPRADWKSDVTAFAAAWEGFKAQTNSIDFHDMIDLACEVMRPACGPDVIIADEVQDFSAAEMKLLRHWTRFCDALIVAGDSWQCLYKWRGTDPENMSAKNLPADHQYILRQSYRVPRAVHKAATEWVKRLSTWEDIQYQPRDEEGFAEKIDLSLLEPDRIVDIAEGHVEDGKSVMIAASCGYMLKPLLRELRSRAVPFHNPWRTARSDWNPLGGGGTTMMERVRCLCRAIEEDRLWPPAEIWAWGEPMRAKGVFWRGGKKKLKEMAELETPADSVYAINTFEPAAGGIIDTFLTNQDTEAALKWWEENLLDTRKPAAEYPLAVVRKHGTGQIKPQISVGTIHSYKGAEADVVILFPDLSSAGEKEWDYGDKDSVVRLFYVGMTRAREGLIVGKPTSAAAPIRQYLE